MELTPQLLHDVQFRDKWRGYDPEEVDDFLERVAASVEQLLERLREATARAERGGPAATGAVGGDPEAITRTLVLAQRTADAAIREAEETAARLVSDAEERAATTLSGAEGEAARVLKSARDRFGDQLDSLEARRDALQADVDALEHHLDEQRRALVGVIEQLLAVADDPDALRSLPAPALRAEPLEPGPGEMAAMPEEPASREPGERPDLSSPGNGARQPDPASVAAARELMGAEPPGLIAPVSAGADDPGGLDGGPPTQATVIDLSDDAGGQAAEHDPFLAELRKAVTDDEPLGPRDDDVGPRGGLYDQDYLEGREGFRSRLKRRG